MKIKIETDKKNSIIEETIIEDSVTDLPHPEYHLKNYGDKTDIVKISKAHNYYSFYEIANRIGIKYNCSGIDGIRKKLKRNFDRALEVLGIDSYMKEFTVAYKAKSPYKYQFAEDSISFLEELYDIDLYKDNKIDKIWLADGIYMCLCHMKDIDDNTLEEIGSVIQAKVDYSSIKYLQKVRSKYEEIEKIVCTITRDKTRSRDEKREIYNSIIKKLDDLIVQIKN